MKTVSDVIALELKKAGVDYAFGVSGETLIPVMESMRKVGIEFILTRHETGAGFMADAVHQLTGNPVALLATQGPGITNLVNATAHAYLDRSRIIVITSSIPTSKLNIALRQNLAHEEILKPVTKYTATLGEKDASQVINRALEISDSERKGPVYINIPHDIAEMEYDYAESCQVNKVLTSPSKTKELKAMEESIVKAKKPIVLVGNGVAKSGVYKVFRQWLSRNRIPCLTTYLAKGTIDETNDLSLGAIGLSKVSDDVHLTLIKQSDLIITIGFDPSEVSDKWLQSPSSNATRINIDSVSALRGFLSPQYEYIGDIGQFLEITMPSDNKGNKRDWEDEELAAHKKKAKKSISAHASTKGLSPYKLTELLREVMPKDTIVTADTGSHRITASQVWDCYEPKTFLQSIGLATMGYSLPAAIGAKLIKQNSPVLCLVGDASLEMLLGEMGMLKQLNLPIIIVVFADRALSRIKIDQEQEGYPVYGTEFEIPDYVAIAKAYGGEGAVCKTLDEVRSVTQEALNRQVFTLIQAEVDPSEYIKQM